MAKQKTCLLILIGIFCIVLSGCGFHSRSPSDIPPQLHFIYLNAPNPYSHQSVQLRRTLKSLNVRFAKSPEDAPVTLHIIDSSMSHDTPTIFYSGNAISYIYSYSTELELLKRNGQPITKPVTLNARRSLLQNSNQVYTPEATRMMERQLTSMMTTLIYNYLTSPGVQKALDKSFSKTK